MTAPELTPPYYAVIFTSRMGNDEGYSEMAERMVALAAQQPGFLGIDSARGADGFGITISYWETEEAITEWKAHAAHLGAQEMGMTRFYDVYDVRIAKVERAYSGPGGRPPVR